jgi:hypothetical protein
MKTPPMRIFLIQSGSSNTKRKAVAKSMVSRAGVGRGPVLMTRSWVVPTHYPSPEEAVKPCC